MPTSHTCIVALAGEGASPACSTMRSEALLVDGFECAVLQAIAGEVGGGGSDLRQPLPSNHANADGLGAEYPDERLGQYSFVVAMGGSFRRAMFSRGQEGYRRKGDKITNAHKIRRAKPIFRPTAPGSAGTSPVSLGNTILVWDKFRTILVTVDGESAPAPFEMHGDSERERSEDGGNDGDDDIPCDLQARSPPSRQEREG